MIINAKNPDADRDYRGRGVVPVGRIQGGTEQAAYFLADLVLRDACGGDPFMNKVIPFPQPLPDIESFPIYFNHTSGEIVMPFVPDCREDAAHVLGNLMVILLEDKILSTNDIYQVAMQAAGEI